MPTSGGRNNRGPAAAADNRLALLAAARRVFAVRGYRAPLSAIAREAGVGQAVLYRHFPTRLDLAFATFEVHFVELEALAADPGAETFGLLLSRLVELTVDESAFIELVVDARRHLPERDLDGRIRRLIDRTLPVARSAGAVRADITTSDVLLLTRMLFGVVVLTTDPDDARDAAARCLALVAIEPQVRRRAQPST